MSFILGILIISALLSIIFGRRIGAMFATGVLGLAAVLVGACGWLFILFLYANGFWSSNTSSASSSYSSYGSTPAYGSNAPSQFYAPVTQTPVPTYQAFSPPPATGTGPRLGVDIVDLPANGAQILAYLHPPAGAGAWIRVHPGSAAEAAGLRSYDVILSAGTETQPADWITPSNQLSDYLDRVGYNVPVRVHVYRATGPCDFWVWVHPR